MQLQIRDSKDPFTQTLAFLFKTAKDAPELKQKMRKDMIPLVTQVAIKIGGIDTEQSVRDRALPVFTGIISLHLANVVNGKEHDAIEEWAKQIATHDLGMLFRKGYTLIDELIKNVRVSRKDDPFLRVQSFAERMQAYSTHIENGVWAGYELYLKQLTSYTDEKILHEFAVWLFEKAGTPVHKLRHDLDIDVEIPETMVSRVLFNVLHSGRISSDLNFKKVRDIVDAARANQKWWVRAQKHYSSFGENLPEKFRKCLARSDSEVTKSMTSTLAAVKRLTNKRTSRYKNIDNICLMAGLNPPGLTKEARKMFPM